MQLLEIQPIINEPALFIGDKKILVIADLHIGIESELMELGLHAPSQTSSIDRLDYSSDTSTAAPKGLLTATNRNLIGASPE